MDVNEYRVRGKEMVDYIADYLENIRDRHVFPAVQPGYMKNLLPETAPDHPEEWESIFNDIERVIMPGVVNWQSPHMHAYFPALNSFPSLLGDMLADAINSLGFTWASSPACTELEIIVMNWLGRMIGLPESFLHVKNGRGGGVIQTTASEATLVCLLAGRTKAIRKFHEHTQGFQDAEINARLVAYCSDQAHSSVEKAALIGLVRMRFIEADENLSLRGAALKEAIEEDIRNGLIPFWVCCTLGTTGACAFDNLNEIGDVCRAFDLWLHIDSAYAGSAFICPEFRVWTKGIEKADSIAFNPSKWLMVHFDCTAMWVTNSAALHRTFNVEPLYLQHENSGLAIDFMHWQIPLSKRFRAIKLWFVIRNYGIKGLQKHIREGVRLAQKFEALILADNRFEIPAARHLGMVVFRLRGENELTEKLLKRLNHRRNLHAVPASLKGKYVIRFTVTSTHTTNDDIIKDWNEIRYVASEILEESNVKIDKRVLLKDTREKNEAFGSSLLLANSPMSPKIVNGSFAAIIDADEFLAKAYAGIRIANQDSPAMRRRVRGILMSGRQFSLDSRMDLAIQGIEPIKVNNGAEQAIDESDENVCQEDYEYTPTHSASQNHQSKSSKDLAANHHKVHKKKDQNSSYSKLINKSVNFQDSSSQSSSFQSSLNSIDENNSTDKFNDFKFTGKTPTDFYSNFLMDKRQSEPAIRFSFYNKLFEIEERSQQLAPLKDFRKYSLPLTMGSSCSEASILSSFISSSYTSPAHHGAAKKCRKGQNSKIKLTINDNEQNELSSSSFESISPIDGYFSDNSCLIHSHNQQVRIKNENRFSDDFESVMGDKQKLLNFSSKREGSVDDVETKKICKKCGH